MKGNESKMKAHESEGQGSPPMQPSYATHYEVQEYLEDFCETHRLKDHIRFR